MPRNPRNKRIGVSALVIVACAAMLFTKWPASPSFDKTRYTEVGRTLAMEGLKLLKPGGKFTIIARDTDEYRQPAMTVALASVQRELKKAGVEIRGIESIQLDPIRPVEIAPGDFYEVLRRSASGDVVLSLLGPPILSDEQKLKLGSPKARIVALIPANLTADSLLKNGWLDVALVNKPGGRGKSFEGLYSVVRAERLAAAGSL